jgi:hypothetical protein
MAITERALNRKKFNFEPVKHDTFNRLAKNALSGNWGGIDQYMNQIAAPLAKALATSNISGFADGTNLVLQNLDSIMTTVLWTEDQLVKQQFIQRVPSINPIYQWNRRNQYASNRGANAFSEGNIGPVGLGSWTRNTEPVRFFGVQRGTTVIANLAGALGGMFDSPIEEEEYDGVMQLLSSVEGALTWGNSTITDGDGNDIFYDGMYRQLKAGYPSNIIDLHGKPMDFDVVSQIAANYAKQYVTTSRDIAGFLTPDSLQTLQLMKTQSERNQNLAMQDGGFAAGTPIDGYRTPIGFIPFVQDVFLKPFQGGTAPLSAADSGSPTAPTTVTATAAAPTTGQTSNWLSSDAATVYYTVSSFNGNGESIGYTYSTGVAVSAGDVVNLAITNVTGAWGYRIYRGLQSNGSDAQWIGDVSSTTTSTAAYTDDNSIMPGTDVAVFMNRNPQNLVIAQMAPLLKLPLAIQNTTIPFGLLYLHTLAVKAPERQFMVVNIGKTAYTS